MVLLKPSQTLTEVVVEVVGADAVVVEGVEEKMAEEDREEDGVKTMVDSAVAESGEVNRREEVIMIIARLLKFLVGSLGKLLVCYCF